MKLIRESVKLMSLLGELNEDSQAQFGKYIEVCGRQCYQSSHKISDSSYSQFITNMIKSGHLSMAEHVSITAIIVTNRGVTHQLVRHRLGSYSQESTRYCNYLSDRFGNELTFIIPAWITDDKISSIKTSKVSDILSDPDCQWYQSMRDAEYDYIKLINLGYTPEKAREVLPNSLATTIAVTYNLRVWRHVLSQRLDKKCHPQMRNLMGLIGSQLIKYLPLFFSDLEELS